MNYEIISASSPSGATDAKATAQTSIAEGSSALNEDVGSSDLHSEDAREGYLSVQNTPAVSNSDQQQQASGSTIVCFYHSHFQFLSY